jgi:hypothetical protein
LAELELLQVFTYESEIERTKAQLACIWGMLVWCFWKEELKQRASSCCVVEVNKKTELKGKKRIGKKAAKRVPKAKDRPERGFVHKLRESFSEKLSKRPGRDL